MVFSAVLDNLLPATLYTVGAAALGIFLMSLTAMLIPKLIDRLTPGFNDQKEIARGNLAVATYTGMVSQAVIVGVSIVLAAAIWAGMS